MPLGFAGYVGKATPDEVARLAKRLQIETASARRISALLDGQLQNVLDDVDRGLPLNVILERFDDTPELRAGLERALIDAVEYGVEAGIAQAGIGMDWTLVNTSAREWANRYSYDLVRGINTTSRTVLQREVPRWVESGEPLKQLAKDLTPTFGKKRAQVIAATEATRAYAEGNMEAWKASGIVKKRQWQTSADEIAEACPICGPLQGQVRGLNEAFGGGISGPPAHVNCRCWLVPVVGELVAGQTSTQQQAQTPTQAQFVPATSKDEVARRMAMYVDEYNLGDLPLYKQNSILKAAEETLGRNRVRCEAINPMQRAKRGQNAQALLYDSGGTEVQFSRRYLSSPDKAASDARVRFEGNRQLNIDYLRKSIADPARYQLVEQNTKKLQHWEGVSRWTVSSVSEDPLEATARHEFYHVIDSRSGRVSEEFSRRMQGVSSWRPSEYSFSNEREFFAETGTAIDMGIYVPEPVVRIFREVLSGAK